MCLLHKTYSSDKKLKVIKSIAMTRAKTLLALNPTKNMYFYEMINCLSFKMNCTVSVKNKKKLKIKEKRIKKTEISL